MKRVAISILAYSLAAGMPLLADGGWRSFKSSTGSELVARVVEVRAAEVVLVRKADGKTFTLALDRLSDADQEFLRNLPPMDDAAEELPENPAGPLSFETLSSDVADYFPDLSVGKDNSHQHFPLGPIGGVIAVSMESDEAEVKSVAPEGPGAGSGLKAGDVLTGAGGRKFSKLAADPATGGDGLPRQLGMAILDAQAKGNPLVLQIKRGAEKLEIAVNLPAMADFTDFSASCVRSTALAKGACHWLAATYSKSGNFGTGDSYSNAFAAIALLASGDPEYKTIIRRHAHKVAAIMEANVDHNNWRASAMGIFLAEYYLATGDATVLDALRECCKVMGERIDGATGRLGHGGTDLPYEGKGLVITSGHAHLLWGLASHCGIPLDMSAWNSSYRSIKAAIGDEGNVGYNFSVTISEQSMARTGIIATALELGGQASGDKRKMYGWIKDNYKRSTNGHTVTSMGLIFGFMGKTNGDARGLRTSLDYHRFLLAMCSPIDPAQGAYYYGLRTNIGGDSYLGFRTVGNYTTALILQSVKKDTLWSFGNRKKDWQR